jgi:uncharacterized protein
MSVVEVRPAGRIAALDVLRGIAILGTFAVNVWLFARPGGPAALLLVGFDVGPVQTVLQFLASGKFLAMLTLLFGVGIELQYRSAVRRGAPWPGRYPLRAAILFVEGLLHYILVFEFDVLMGYAIASLLVAHLVGCSDRVVRAWVAVVGGSYVAAILGLTALMLADPGAAPGEPVVSGGTASWLEQVEVRLQYFLLFRIELVLIVPSAVVLFLVGSRLLRYGTFDDSAAGARSRRRLMVAGLGVAFPLNALTTFAGLDWFLVSRYLLPPVVALGLLGLVTTLVLRARHLAGPVRRGLAAVGRAALSCYVLQNVLASVLCYGWGLGLADRFADVRPWWVLGLWAVVSAALVAFASLWLRRFDRGPLELLVHRVYAARRAPAASRG